MQIAVLSAFLGPDQAATEVNLATDPDFAPWVKKYQDSRDTVSQTDYEVRLVSEELNSYSNAIFCHFLFPCSILFFYVLPGVRLGY